MTAAAAGGGASEFNPTVVAKPERGVAGGRDPGEARLIVLVELLLVVPAAGWSASEVVCL